MLGNNCGHVPDMPRWFSPPEDHARPHIIKKVITSIRKYYIDPASTIPSLNLANGSDRQQRSERREACLDVLGCLLHYLDLVTLRVGVPQSDASFKGISMPFIAERSGLTLRRTERAVADLVKAGLLSVHPLCQKISDCVYRGYAAIRTISPKLFSVFGLGGRLKYERERASARRKKKDRKEFLKGKAKIDLMMDGAANKSVTLSPVGDRQQSKSKNSSRVEELKSIKEILNTS